MSYNSKVHFTPYIESTEFTVESGGHVDVDSGGYISLESGGYLKYPVVGCTSSYIALSGTSEAAVLPSNGYVFALINGTSSRRHCDIPAPYAGARLTLVVSKDAASSSGGIVFHSSDATYDSTNNMIRWVSSGSTYVTTQDGYGVLELVGHSTGSWLILRQEPSTGWVACAST